MTKPNITFDWTINISSLISVILFAFTALGAWYSLKEEVAVNKATSDLQFSTIVITTSEIKLDIKELKNDVKTLR